MSINKIHREKIDLKIAYSSGLNSFLSKDNKLITTTNDMERGKLETKSPMVSFRKRLKRLTWCIYFPLKFFLKPFTLRIRQYLTATLTQMVASMHQEMQSNRQLLEKEVQLVSETISSQLRTTQKEIARIKTLLNKTQLPLKVEDKKRRGIIVVGAGGHAKVCIELLRAMNEEVSFCVGTEDSPNRCLDVPVLKGEHSLDFLREEGFSRAFIAIGENKRRDELAIQVESKGYRLVNAISPQAIISSSAHLGSGIAIMAGVIINAEVRIEDLAIINTAATVDHDCWIGRAVHIAPQCALAGKVQVGSQSFLGLGSKVIPGQIIEEKVTAGAGSVIINNISSGLSVIGIPARQMNYGQLKKEALCSESL